MAAPRRVPVEPGFLRPGVLALGADARHYVSSVLRLAAGAELVLFDGEGRRARASLQGDGRVEVADVEEAPPLPTPRITLLCGLSKADKLETIIEKACEVGAYAVWPVETARSVVRLNEERAAGKLERWRRIAAAASRQCGRDHALQVAAPSGLEAALQRAPAGERRALVVGAPALTAGLPERMEDVVLLTGPEGGLDAHEVELAANQGFQPAGLGTLTLRAETAPVVAAAAVLARAGRL